VINYFLKASLTYEKNLYQRNIDLKVIDFPLIKQSNDLNTSYECFGHVAEWLRRGLQIVSSGSTQYSITQYLSQ
jgi:hypothetical protein